MKLIEDLEDIYEKVISDPQNVEERTKRRFWRIVGMIKRMPESNDSLILKAAEIRDILYENRLGKPKSLKWPFIWVILGVFSVYGFLWLILYGPQYTGIFFNDVLFVMGPRAACIGGAIVGFYPFGRLIGGKFTGIRLDGITRDIRYRPALKLNYVTYLKAAPPKRQWFFFFAGLWTVFTAAWIGAFGFLLSGEWIGLAIALADIIFEVTDALLGGPMAGELAHFRREHRIVSDWKQAITTK